MASLGMSLRNHVSHLSQASRRRATLGSPTFPAHSSRGKSKHWKHSSTYISDIMPKQCDLIGRHAKGRYSSVETHRDIMDIAQLLQQPLSREEVRKRMSDFLKPADKEQHENSINLVARLLLMIKFGDIPHECGGGRHIEWSHGSLLEFVHDYFSPPPACGHERIKLEKSFNALNLQRIAGIKFGGRTIWLTTYA